MPNRDLLDDLHEGKVKDIRVINEVPVLVEGDALSDFNWHGGWGTYVRYLVGKKTWFRKCEWCRSAMHHQIQERKYEFTGRSGKNYVKFERIEYGFVCPVCGATRGPND
jgi:hypothetical protein